MAREAAILGIRLRVWLCVSACLLALHLLRLGFDSETENGMQVMVKGSTTSHSRVTPVHHGEAKPLRTVFTAADSSHGEWTRILQRLSDPDTGIRLEALEDLRRLGPHANEAVPVLISCLQDLDPQVRAYAATQLGAHRMAAADAVPRLKSLAFNDSDDVVRSRAKDALYNIRLYDFSPDNVGTPVP